MSRMRALTVADGLLGVAILSLIVSLIWPTLTEYRFTDTVDETIVRIERVRERAVLTQSQTGVWPDQMGADPADDAETLAWRVWNRVEQVAIPAVAPPPDADPGPASAGSTTASVVRSFGAIEVTTTSEPLLAALLDHYGRDDSFVRDSTWTLVLQPQSSLP